MKSALKTMRKLFLTWVNQNNKTSIITMDKDKSKIREIKQRIKDILIKQRIKDYVVIDNIDNNNQLKIVNKDHAEKLGIYHFSSKSASGKILVTAYENKIQQSLLVLLDRFLKRTVCTKRGGMKR